MAPSLKKTRGSLDMYGYISRSSYDFFFPWLTSKVLLPLVVDRTKRRKGETFTKRSQTSGKSAKRMRDFPVKEGRGTVGRGPGGKILPCQWTPPLPLPSRVVLSMIWNVLAENQKLKIDFNFQFSIFWLASETQTKRLHRLQHCRRYKIASQFHFFLHCQ